MDQLGINPNQAIIRVQPLPDALLATGEIHKDTVVLLVDKRWGLWDPKTNRIAPIFSDVLQEFLKFHAPASEVGQQNNWGHAFEGTA